MIKTLLALACLTAALCARAEERLLLIDASAPVAAPSTGHLKLGTAVAPNGQRLAVNSRYLSLDDQPWLPVMGEFHYSRSPAASWEAELLKMKAAGVDIVASYVIWNHHELNQGHFDWQGNRDLRRFVQLAAKAGLKAVVRIGPWSHAEVRFGGFPDWLVNSMPTRSNDAQYLLHVERFYAQIGQQLKDLLWKDGGPVMGLQLENEYNLSGPGRGAEHIAALKQLAIKAGMDVPLYTVTGWDGAVYPSGEVTPVFGGYPDEPWSKSATELPAKETYAFRFDSRVSGDLGAQTAASARGTAETDIALTPFLGAEYGVGLPAMYRRRTLVSADDIAAMLPVQLGSGVNLLGYYMFHGGRNPRGDFSLEESTASGGYNDTPRINYDFQAPLGPDGQQREVLTRLRPFHLFLASYGAQLATMTVRKPEAVPPHPTELTTPRLALRSHGDSGFLFVNNHVRQHAMPEFRDLRFSLKLPGGTLTLPREAITLRNGDSFIWPINLDLDGTRLVYASAQVVTRFDAGPAGIVHVFMAAADQPVELAFSAADATHVQAPQTQRSEDQGQVLFKGIQPGTSPALTINKPGQRPVIVLVLSAAQGRSLVLGEFAGRKRLLLSEQQLWTGNGGLELRSTGEPRLRFAIYPALAAKPRANLPLKAVDQDGLFQVYEATAQAFAGQVSAQQTREARPAPKIQRGGHAGAALQPIPEAFGTAASWQLELGRDALTGPALDEVLLELDIVGDMGRLYGGTEMLDDWYFNGQRWQIGLKALSRDQLAKPLSLSILPLRADAPIYLPREHRPDFAGQPQIAQLRGLRLLPVYRLSMRP
ncbi:beta-galactosidase [Pelomonas sp. SE-A7]|uniref:beta-galactosidase n=1 Tax=Pelomonas sp. SE-A7 TaxID=3054953 RepID=UPI00259CE67E|nr:beta-galactosidase [Pelomonas sp. SE-A7]MDM4765275.1 beta-galactosidase [Pelomonas sp. SE-A7]